MAVKGLLRATQTLFVTASKAPLSMDASIDAIDLSFDESTLTRDAKLKIQDGDVLESAPVATAVEPEVPATPADPFEASADAVRVFDATNVEENSTKPLTKKQLIEKINREEMDDEFDMVFEEEQKARQNADGNDSESSEAEQISTSERRPKLSIQVDEFARAHISPKIDVPVDEEEQEEYTDPPPKITVSPNPERRASISALHTNVG
jgi:hypothetical protein